MNYFNSCFAWFAYEKKRILKIMLRYLYNFRYKITEDTANNKYKVDMSAHVCYEDGAACAESFTIFTDTEFSMKSCTYNDGFLDPGNVLSPSLCGPQWTA